MRFGSVCSGIEAASVAWHPLGWQAAWLAEIDPFPCAVLAHYYPAVPNLGDMRAIAERITNGEVEAPDVFTGGTPCQAFSVAGNRQSLSDDRGSLTLTFCEIANAIDNVRFRRGEQPSIIVWENVPGVLNTKDNAFGCFLAALAGEECPLEPAGQRWTDAGCVYGPQRAIAWRVLDAQYFGLAQRRKRVFVVASARAGFNPASVLFEWEGVRRDSAPRREAGKDTAGSTGRRASGLGYVDDVANCLQTTANNYSRADGFNMVAQSVHCRDVAQAITSNYGKQPDNSDTGLGPNLVAFHPTQDPISSTDGTTHAMGTGSKGGCATVAVAVACETVGTLDARTKGGGFPGTDGAAAGHVQPHGMAVRRLTPRECERLQGFPDDYTSIPWRGKPADQCPDGPRYKALGNSWAVPCARWIGRRIAEALS